MAESRLKRSGSPRRSSKRRRRRRSTISTSSYGGIDEEEDSMLKMFENDEEDDDMELYMNNDDEDEGEDDYDSPRNAREKKKREMEKRINEELLLEKINHCKELIENVKNQTWKISRKLHIHAKARAYVEKHEGNLSRRKGYQQRGKQLMRQLLRTWTNWIASLVPWEMKIKRIESHFGSVVASYFVFLRWLIWLSLWLAVLPACFIVIPELLVGEAYGSNSRKQIPDNEEELAYDLQTMWNAEGIMKYSILFYGYYGNEETIGEGYRLPLAYLLTNLAAFAYSFIVLLKTMADNSRQSRLSNKDEEYTFAWKLFTEWDYMIGSHETATTKHASITTTFKETILEEKVKAREGKKWPLLTSRVVANVIIVMLLALSTYIIQLCVERSRTSELNKRNDENYNAGFWEENELTVVMTLISTVFPNVLDIISLMEKFHPRTSLRLMLGRIFVLNLLNLYTLFIALYNKQNDLLTYIETLELNATILNNCTGLNKTASLSGSADPQSLGSAQPGSQVAMQDFLNSTTEPHCVNKTLLPQSAQQLCWETMIGQEVFKLTVMDTIFVLGQLILVDVVRSYFIKYCNNLCCWDLEKTFPEYPEFKTAENLLHLIGNQGVVWLGALFAPGLPLLNLLKLLLLVYVRCWTVLVFNVPEDRIFRASRSNNFYYALLLIMLFLSMLPPLFAIVGIEPSPDCGPFSGRQRMYQVLTETMENELPSTVNSIIEYAASPGVIMPLFMLLGMTIYYLISNGRSLREANNELRMQLEYERTEGRRKVYAMADAKNEAREKDKSKGWMAAKSKFIPPGDQGGKDKGVANAFTSILQAARASKAASDTGKPGGRNGMARNGGVAKKQGDQALLNLLQAVKGKGTPTPPIPAAKKQGDQALLNLLQAVKGKGAPSIPVAVIKGKQSIKANSRDKNKQAAMSDFRKALVEFARQQQNAEATAEGNAPSQQTEENDSPVRENKPKGRHRDESSQNRDEETKVKRSGLAKNRERKSAFRKALVSYSREQKQLQDANDADNQDQNATRPEDDQDHGAIHPADDQDHDAIRPADDQEHFAIRHAVNTEQKQKSNHRNHRKRQGAKPEPPTQNDPSEDDSDTAVENDDVIEEESSGTDEVLPRRRGEDRDRRHFKNNNQRRAVYQRRKQVKYPKIVIHRENKSAPPVHPKTKRNVSERPGPSQGRVNEDTRQTKTMSRSDKQGALPRSAPRPIRDLRRRLSASSMVDENGHLKLYDEDSDSLGDDDDESEDNDDVDSNHYDNNSGHDSENEDGYADDVVIDVDEQGDDMSESLDRSLAREEKLNKRKPFIPKNAIPLPIATNQVLSRQTKSLRPKTTQNVAKAHVEFVDESLPPRFRKHQKVTKRNKPDLERTVSSGSITGPVPEIKVEDFSHPASLRYGLDDPETELTDDSTHSPSHRNPKIGKNARKIGVSGPSGGRETQNQSTKELDTIENSPPQGAMGGNLAVNEPVAKGKARFPGQYRHFEDQGPSSSGAMDESFSQEQAGSSSQRDDDYNQKNWDRPVRKMGQVKVLPNLPDHLESTRDADHSSTQKNGVNNETERRKQYTSSQEQIYSVVKDADVNSKLDEDRVKTWPRRRSSASSQSPTPEEIENEKARRRILEKMKRRREQKSSRGEPQRQTGADLKVKGGRLGYREEVLDRGDMDDQGQDDDLYPAATTNQQVIQDGSSQFEYTEEGATENDFIEDRIDQSRSPSPSDYAALRKDRPSLTPMESDEEVDDPANNLRRSRRNLSNRPRQLSESEIEALEETPMSPLDRKQGFTILAITNGNLDLSADDDIEPDYDDDDDDEIISDATANVRDGSNGNPRLYTQHSQRSSDASDKPKGFSQILNMFENQDQ